MTDIRDTTTAQVPKWRGLAFVLATSVVMGACSGDEPGGQGGDGGTGASGASTNATGGPDTSTTTDGVGGAGGSEGTGGFGGLGGAGGGSGGGGASGGGGGMPTPCQTLGNGYAPLFDTYTLEKIDVVAPDLIWAAGNDGTVVKSVGGFNWCSLPTGTHTPLNDVDFVDASTGWAVGDSGITLRSTDGGLTWTTQSTPTTNHLYAVHAISSGAAVAVGAAGTTLRTNDAGSTWSYVSGATTDDLTAVMFANAQDGWAVGDNGRIVVTSDAAQTWTQQFSGVTANLGAVSFISSTEGYAIEVLDGTTAVHTTNGGTTWSATNQYFVSPLHGWRRLPSSVEVTVDGGSTWTPVGVDGVPGWRPRAAFLDDSTGWHVGDLFIGDEIYATTDGGITWQQTTPDHPTTEPLLDVFFISGTTGWGVGEQGTVVATKDGGATWKTVSAQTFDDLRAVTAVDTQHAWTVGNQGTIRATTDGGATWIIQNSTTGADLYDVHFASTMVGWAVGAGGTVVGTTDGGATWAAQVTGLNPPYPLFTVHFLDAQTGFAAGEAGTFLRTTDGGSTWTSDPQYLDCLGNCGWRDIAFATATTGWMVGEAGFGPSGLMKTTDAGQTWAPSPGLVSSWACTGLDFLDPQHGIIGCWEPSFSGGGRLLITSDGGATWIPIDSAFPRQWSNIQAISASLAFAVGGNLPLGRGGIWQLGNPLFD